MAYRYRANIFFKESSPAGLAQWCSDQVNQRLTMSFHMNEGALNEEKTKHEVVDNRHWRADVFVPDEAQAIMDDFWAQIMTQTTHMETRVIEPEEEEGEPEYEQSWMDVHHCWHDVGGACMPPHMTFETPLPEPPGDLCDTTDDWDIANATQYQTDFGNGLDVYVKHDNAIWKAKSGSHLWIAPSHTGDGSISWEHVKDCI